MSEGNSESPTPASPTNPAGDGTEPKPDPVSQVAAGKRMLELLSELEASVNEARANAQAAQSERARLAQVTQEIQEQESVARAALQVALQRSNELKNVVGECAALHAGAQTSSKQVAEIAGQATAQKDSLQSVMAIVTDASNRASKSVAEIEQQAELAKTRSQHVEEGRLYVDGVRQKIDAAASAARSAQSSADGYQSASRDASQKIDALLAAAQAQQVQVGSIAAAVGEAKTQADANTATTKGLADAANALKAKIEAHELRLSELETQATAQLKRVEDLLPGATTAGLASAFGARRKGFYWQIWTWQICSVIAILGLFGLVLWEFLAVGTTGIPEYKEILRGLVHRLPLAIPVIWFALYSARQASLAMRLEEEYAHKEVVSRSFEGFKKQMQSVESELGESSPLRRLCNDALITIANPPGRIYDKHQPDVTPLTALADSAPRVAGSIGKAVSEATKG